MSALQAECRRFESDYLHQPSPKLRLAIAEVSSTLLAEQAGLIFENWELGIKENYNSYTRSGRERSRPEARKISQGKNPEVEFC